MTRHTPDTCTTREAAERLGVSLRTVQLWTESGILDAWKTPGGHRRVLTASVDRLLAQRKPAETLAANPRMLDVLVVEDEPALLQLYQLNLETSAIPVDVRIARNGYEGLIHIGERRPDVLITDLMMPGIDGFQMLRTLRAHPELSTMRVVVVTGLQSRDVAERGGVPEGVTVLGKPIPFDQLEKLLHAAALDLGREIPA